MENAKCVCIVEDELDVAETLIEFFTAQGFEVAHYRDYDSFSEAKLSKFTGVYLVDWNLPDRPGTEIVNYIRKRDKVSPIFIVSGYSDKADIVQGLKLGADDYITKPFNFDELLIRVENALAKYKIVQDCLDDEIIKFLPEARSFIKDGKTVQLTSREYIIFFHLFTKLSEAISREELTLQFSDSEKITPRNIDVHVFSLRKKLAPVGMEIETVWKQGYMLSL